VNGPAWILWEVGVEELVEPLAAHPGRKDERSVHPCQPSHGTPEWVRHPLGVVDDTGDTDERRIEWTVFPVHELVTWSRPGRSPIWPAADPLKAPLRRLPALRPSPLQLGQTTVKEVEVGVP